MAEKTGAYWAIAMTGYVLQMAAVPALALAGSWQAAALFIVLERSGKAVRNPAANLMLSRAGAHIGQGWAFGLHEAMDQTGACGGPLIAALVLAHHGDYRTAFLWLGIPAAADGSDGARGAAALWLCRASVAMRRRRSAAHLPRAFWIYAAASALVGFGFADYPLIAFHFARIRRASSRPGFRFSMPWPCWHRARVRCCSAAGSTGAAWSCWCPDW